MNPTPEQWAVIRAQEKYLLINACAGSGKTSTLVERCKALPGGQSKLVLAFNKEARDVFYNRVSGGASRADVRTFHSFCLAQIRKDPAGFGYTKNPTIDGDTSLLKMMCEAHGREYHTWKQSPWDDDVIRSCQHSEYNSDLYDHIEKNKPTILWEELKQLKIEFLKKEGHDNLIHLGEIEDDEEVDYPAEILEIEDQLREWESRIGLLRLRDWLQEKNIVTFDEMVRVVAENVNYMQPMADHVLVDEFQDVDRFQFDIVAAIGRQPQTKSVACVGDPCQLIYAWRGALGNAFESFQEMFDAKEYKLTVNFRSYEDIIQEAEKVFQNGMKGVKGFMKGAVMNLGEATSSDYLGELMGDIHPSQYKELAILCRTNRDVASWNVKLAKKGIPVNVIGKSDFWNGQHVKLANAARMRRLNIDQLLNSEEWGRLMKTKRFRRNETAREEAIDDAKFVLEMTEEDYGVMRRSMSNKDGVRISTMHKTKGMEFRRVLIANVTEQLKNDKCVYYVAITRAKERLIYG